MTASDTVGDRQPTSRALSGWARRAMARRWPQVLTLLIGSLLAALLWTTVLVFERERQNAGMETLQAETYDLSIGLAQETAEKFLPLTLLLTFLKHDIELDPAHFDLELWLERAPPLGSLAFQLSQFDAQGQLVASSMPDAYIGDDFSDRAYFSVHVPREIGLELGRSFTGRVHRDPVITLSRRLEHRDGSFAGVIMASLDPTYVADFLAGVHLGEDGRAFVSGEDGFVRSIASGTGMLTALIDRKVDWPSSQRDLQVSGTRLMTDADDGHERLYTYRRVAGLPLYVAVGAPTAGLLAELGQNSRLVMRYSALVTAVLIVLLLLLLRAQTKRQADAQALSKQAMGLERLNRELATSEARYRGMLDSMTEIVFQTDAHGRWSLLNPAWEVLTGYPVAQSIGRHFVSHLHPDDRGRVIAEARSAIANGTELYLDGVRYVARGRSVRWLEVRARALGSEGARDGSMAGTMTDVTERTLASQALKDSETRLAEQTEVLTATVENSERGVIMIDASRKIVVSNRCVEEIYDLPPEFMSSAPTIDGFLECLLRSGEFQKMPSPTLTVERAGRLDHRFTFEYERPNGDFIEVRAIALSNGGAVRSYENVTARRRAAQELIAAKEQAEAGGRARAAFLATMSHEIRTPLNGIIGLGNLLTATELDALQQQLVSGLLRSGDHLLQLINDILDFSKLDAARMELNRAPVNVPELVQTIVSMLNSRAVSKGLVLHHAIAPEVPECLLGDSGRLRQILLNIAGNAVKFTDSGSVTLEVTGQPVDASTVDVTFSVADTGIGISEKDQALLFREFEQVDASFTRRHQGTGLGLAISYRLAALMDSRIELESAPGQGSRFWMTIRMPISEAAPEPGEAEPSLTVAELVRSRGGLRILLAEDNETNQFVAATMLQNQGCTVDVVGDGHAALAAAGRQAYDLILMDMMMPGMDGLAATRAIRDLPQGGDLPILALTANAFEQDRTACLAAGMTGFVTKPISPRKLDVAIAAALTGGVIPTMIEETAVAIADPGMVDVAPAPESAPTGLDIAAVRILQETYGKALDRFVALFIAETAERLSRATTLAASRDMETLARDAHTLKGSALTFGCSEFARIASSLEQAARREEPGLELLATRLVASFEDARHDLETVLKAAA